MPLSLRAVLSTSRWEKVFFYFIAHEKGLEHMFQKLVPNPLVDMDPFADLDPPPPPYLVTNSICKLFVDVLFNHNTTFLNKDKEKELFHQQCTTQCCVLGQRWFANISGNLKVCARAGK